MVSAWRWRRQPRPLGRQIRAGDGLSPWRAIPAPTIATTHGGAQLSAAQRDTNCERGLLADRQYAVPAQQNKRPPGTKLRRCVKGGAGRQICAETRGAPRFDAQPVFIQHAVRLRHGVNVRTQQKVQGCTAAKAPSHCRTTQLQAFEPGTHRAPSTAPPRCATSAVHLTVALSHVSSRPCASAAPRCGGCWTALTCHRCSGTAFGLRNSWRK
jgi:hypothetical protein